MAGAVEMLECEFAALVDAPGAVATGFGRSALHLALLEAEVRGGEVLVPDFICAQVPEAVRRAGADIVFYPVSRDLGVDPAGFEAAFTNRTRAAVAAHYFGRVLSEIRPLAAICRRRGVPLIEDGALALGATLDGRACGSFGELAAFSFTKSDWCYGGGMVIAREEGRLARLRALRGRSLHRRATLAWRYGLLRRADFAANRPAMSRAAERAGRWLERLAGAGGDNFYDAGRFDAALPGFAARRARRVLANLQAATPQRQEILRELQEALGNSGARFRPDADPGDAAAFLLLHCPAGRAEHWREQAGRRGITLRRCWPAYQELAPAQQAGNAPWLAEHLVLVEIHPETSGEEARRIADTLAAFSARA